MLILVGVTVNVALNGGLFSKARTAVTKKEEQVIYDQIVSSMNLGDNGDILVKETYSAAKNLLEGQGNTVSIVNPSTEENIVDSVEFTVTGNSGTYTYTITNDRIIIGSGEVVYSFTLNSLGEWTEVSDSRIIYNVEETWGIIGDDLSRDTNYAQGDIEENGFVYFSVETDNEDFGDLINPESENARFLVAVECVKDDFSNYWGFVVHLNNEEGDKALSDNPSGEQMTYEDFLNTYGDVVFRFVKVSSEETTE